MKLWDEGSRPFGIMLLIVAIGELVTSGTFWILLCFVLLGVVGLLWELLNDWVKTRAERKRLSKPE